VTSQGATRERLTTVWILALGTFAIGTDTFLVAGVLPQIGAAFDVSTSQGGQMVTAFAVSLGILAPLLAVATAKVSRRLLLPTALTVFCLANVASLLASDFTVLLATRVLAAAGAATYTPAAAAAAAMLASAENRGRALAIVLGGNTVATVLGVPAAIWLGTSLSWRAAFGLVAALSAVTVVVLILLLPRLPTPSTAPLRQRLGVLTDRNVLPVIATTLLFMLGGFTVYTYLGTALVSSTRLGSSGVIWMFLVFGCFGLIGNTVGGRLTDKWGPNRVLLAGLAGFAIALFALPMASRSVPGTAVALAVWALCAWTLTVSQQHRLVSIAPQTFQVALGLNSSAVFLGIGLSGALGGLAHGWMPVGQLGYLGAALVAAAALVAWIQIRSVSRVTSRVAAEPDRATL
jgi:DHA1 family inner membrane transport protein